MNKKIKLTELRHLETCKEKMDNIKGGDDPELGPISCKVHCDCSISCTNELNDQQEKFERETYYNSGHSTASSIYGVIGMFLPFTWNVPFSL